MKQIFTSLLLSFFCVIGMLNAQDTRYIDEIFTDVTVESNVQYAVNATVIAIPQVGEAIPQPLLMDIYQPEGDTETERPVVMVFHTGNFLPAISNAQIAGTKTDNSAIEICTQLAKRGFVAVSVDYRLGWNPLAESQPLRALGLIQAAYRGVQDGFTAIRFLRSTVDAGNAYGIDDSKIAVWGNGTGGYISLAMSTLNDDPEIAYGQILSTTNPALKFWLDADGDGTPETPMVVPAFHGDVEGKVLTVTPAEGFGFPAGDTTNYSNHAQFSSEFALGINIGGALGDIAWLDENTNATISVQSPFDQFAPYEDGIVRVPTTMESVVQAQGSLLVATNQNALGNLNYADETYDDDITATAIANSATAGHEYQEGLFPFIRPANSQGIDEGVVINWWDPAGATPVDSPCMGLPYNVCPHPLGGTFDSNGQILNEGMSAEKSRANIADVMAYVLPRMYDSMNLSGISSVDDLPISETELAVSPNPASDMINISAADAQIERVVISDLSGRSMMVLDGSYSAIQAIDVTTLESGVYIIQAQLENSIATTRLTVK